MLMLFIYFAAAFDIFFAIFMFRDALFSPFDFSMLHFMRYYDAEISLCHSLIMRRHYAIFALPPSPLIITFPMRPLACACHACCH